MWSLLPGVFLLLAPIEGQEQRRLSMTLAEARRRAGDSYQIYIRDANKIFRTAVDGKPRREAVDALQEGGFSVETYFGPDSMHEVKCPAGTNFKLSSGLIFRLRSRLEPRTEPGKAASTPRASVVFVRLECDPNMALTEAVRKGLFPRGTVAKAFLGKLKVERAFRTFPYLQSVSIGYSRKWPGLGDWPGKWARQTYPYEFDLRAWLGNAVTKTRSRELISIDATAKSFLDPPETLAGKPVWSGYKYGEAAGAISELFESGGVSG